MKLRTLAFAVTASLLVAGCTNPTPDLQSAVLSSFCQQLAAERKAEAAKNDGVPTVVWPDVTEVENRIKAALGVDHQEAEKDFLHVRMEGALADSHHALKIMFRCRLSS